MLRRHVTFCADYAHLQKNFPAQKGEAEVGDANPTGFRFENEVAGLDVSVRDALLVRVVKRFGDFGEAFGDVLVVRGI